MQLVLKVEGWGLKEEDPLCERQCSAAVRSWLWTVGPTSGCCCFLALWPWSYLMSQFPHLWNGDNSICFIRPLWRINELISMKCLEWCLTRKCYINVLYHLALKNFFLHLWKTVAQSIFIMPKDTVQKYSGNTLMLNIPKLLHTGIGLSCVNQKQVHALYLRDIICSGWNSTKEVLGEQFTNSLLESKPL